MQFKPHSCPTCGELAEGTLETVPGLALLNFDEDGHADYAGETKVYWDGQKTDFDAEGLVTLQCPQGHLWQATMNEG